MLSAQENALFSSDPMIRSKRTNIEHTSSARIVSPQLPRCVEPPDIAHHRPRPSIVAVIDVLIDDAIPLAVQRSSDGMFSALQGEKNATTRRA